MSQALPRRLRRRFLIQASLASLVLVAAILLLAAIIVQWRVRVAVRYGKMRQGDPNKMALRRWGAVEQMARLAGQEMPEQAYWIAQKARFSQHTVSAEELLVLDSVARQLRQSLRTHGIHKRLVYTLILALY